MWGCAYRYTVNTARNLGLSIKGCSHECYKDVLEPRCCPGYWGTDCSGEFNNTQMVYLGTDCNGVFATHRDWYWYWFWGTDFIGEFNNTQLLVLISNRLSW